MTGKRTLSPQMNQFIDKMISRRAESQLTESELVHEAAADLEEYLDSRYQRLRGVTDKLLGGHE